MSRKMNRDIEDGDVLVLHTYPAQQGEWPWAARFADDKQSSFNDLQRYAHRHQAEGV